MPTYDTILSVADLAALLDSQSLRVVDCRFSLLEPQKGREDFLAGHVPGAVYANLDKDLAGPITSESGRHPLPTVDDFVATLRRWGISNDTQVVAYDDGSGGLAARLWWMLRWVGHTKVALLDGGFAAWRDAGMPTAVEEVEPPAGSISAATPDVSRILSTEELASEIDKTRFTLVDARDAARFRGEVEPIDALAGHVPGALNFPFSESISPDGRWRSADELKSRWDALLPESEATEWGVMCGSGVTACHLALSAAIAGRPEPRLYVGSWSEWIRDPARPVVTGEEAAGKG